MKLVIAKFFRAQTRFGGLGETVPVDGRKLVFLRECFRKIGIFLTAVGEIYVGFAGEPAEFRREGSLGEFEVAFYEDEIEPRVRRDAKTNRVTRWGSGGTYRRALEIREDAVDSRRELDPSRISGFLVVARQDTEVRRDRVPFDARLYAATEEETRNWSEVGACRTLASYGMLLFQTNGRVALVQEDQWPVDFKPETNRFNPKAFNREVCGVKFSRDGFWFHGPKGWEPAVEEIDHDHATVRLVAERTRRVVRSSVRPAADGLRGQGVLPF